MLNGQHTVILATYERPGDVAALLDDLAGQTVAPDEVLVVDDTPGEAIEELVAAWKGPFSIRYLRNPGPPSLTRSRNLAKAHVETGIVTFLDSDISLSPDYLERLRALIGRHPDAAGWMGWVADYPHCAWWKNLGTKLLCISHARANQCRLFFPLHVSYPTRPRGDLRADYVYGCNMSFPARVVRTHDFEARFERYAYGEDLDYSMRVAADTPGGFWLAPDAVIWHRRSESGRIPAADYFRMRILHKHVLARRHYRIGPLRLLKLWWSDVGHTVYYSLLWPEKAAAVREARRVLRRAMRDRPEAVRSGDVSMFADLFAFTKKG